MKCPKCGLENPSSATVCQCGQSLVTEDTDPEVSMAEQAKELRHQARAHTNVVSEQQEKLGAFPYVIGGLSFIPAIGVLFGVIAVVWGFATKKLGGKKLALIGAGGIAFTVVIYSAFFYFFFVERDSIYDDLRVQLAHSSMTNLVQAIEFHKTQNGEYPQSLNALREALPENSMTLIFDPTHLPIGGESRLFHYELVDSDHYYLLGVGPDGQPYTNDDIVPTIEVSSESEVGLLIKNPPQDGL